MTTTQRQAIWELCRQGLQEAAAQAEVSWKDGERFEPEPRTPLTRQVALLIDYANRGTRTNAAPRRAGPAPNRPAIPISAAGLAPSRQG